MRKDCSNETDFELSGNLANDQRTKRMTFLYTVCLQAIEEEKKIVFRI